MLAKSEVIDLVERYTTAVTKELSPSAVVIFGSYIDGTPTEDSDIDIGVIFNGFSGDRRSVSKKIWDLAYDISFEIEPHLLDIKDDKSGFANHVYKTGQVVYQAPVY
ncbi:MAG: nucleotidyltransferase domain-containing protein [Oscillospiraceae bacterium]|nr:nucleotidyltransferase domain-containing protein [Oscillospiraceae bacterium]